jgi:hypothetical protein
VSQRSRAALFVVIAVALIAAGALLGTGAHTATPPSRSPERRRSPPPSLAVADHAAVASAARRFLDAFLDYETGDRGDGIRQQLDATATPALASQLRAEISPAMAPQSAGAARLGPLRILGLATDPPLASVTAVAHRPSGPEQLSFVFSRRRGRWLASAPGE